MHKSTPSFVFWQDGEKPQYDMIIEVLCIAVRIESIHFNLLTLGSFFFVLCFSPQVILWSYLIAQLSVYMSPSPPPGVLCIPRIPMSSRTSIRT